LFLFVKYFFSCLAEWSYSLKLFQNRVADCPDSVKFFQNHIADCPDSVFSFEKCVADCSAMVFSKLLGLADRSATSFQKILVSLTAEREKGGRSAVRRGLRDRPPWVRCILLWSRDVRVTPASRCDFALTD